MGSGEQVTVIRKLTDVLDDLEIEYAIGGSIASSLYGNVRFTQDADITVEPFREVVEKFCELLKDEFYVSTQPVSQALDSAGGFNVIHLETSFKIDIFVRGDSEFEKQLLTRSSLVRLSDSIAEPFCVVSPEDVILLKLRWYAQSGCASERQWDDILGVLRVQGESLDIQYLEVWSKKLGVDEPLQRAISESRAY